MFTRDFTRNSPRIHQEFHLGLTRDSSRIPPLIHPGFTWNSSRNLLEILPGIHSGFLPGFTLDSPGIHSEFLPEFPRSSSQGSPGIPAGIPPLIHPKFRFSISEIPSGISRGMHLGSFKGTTRHSPGISSIHPAFFSVFIHDSSRASSGMPLGIQPGILTGFNLEFSQDSPGIPSKIHP